MYSYKYFRQNSHNLAYGWTVVYSIRVKLSKREFKEETTAIFIKFHENSLIFPDTKETSGFSTFFFFFQNRHPV